MKGSQDFQLYMHQAIAIKMDDYEKLEKEQAIARD